LTIFDNGVIIVDMSAKLPPEERVKNAGISLEPEFIERCKAEAKARGFRSLSAFVRHLLHHDMNPPISPAEGKNLAQTHSGVAASVIHEPFDGGFKPPQMGLKSLTKAKSSK
jgi:hypothetical protein